MIMYCYASRLASTRHRHDHLVDDPLVLLPREERLAQRVQDVADEVGGVELAADEHAGLVLLEGGERGGLREHQAVVETQLVGGGDAVDLVADRQVLHADVDDKVTVLRQLQQALLLRVKRQRGGVGLDLRWSE